MVTGLGRSFGISASQGRDDTSPPAERWIRPWLAQSEGNARRELEALRRENDVELLGEGLLSFAARQERAGREELAAQVYATLSGAERELLPPSIADRAERRLAALNGQGRTGDRAEVLARHFIREATDPITLLAMTAGSTVYATARAAFLSRFLAAPAGAWTRGLGARALAAGGAFSIEIPAFWTVNKGLREARRPGSQSWDLATNARELASLSLSLGALKLAGSGATSLYARTGLRSRGGAALFQQAGMFTGILAGHGVETWVGLRPASDGATTLLDSLVLLLQFNVGLRLSREIMGSRGLAATAELEARLRSAVNRPPAWQHSFGGGMESPLALAMSGARPPRAAGSDFEFSRPQFAMMEGGPGSAESQGRVWKNLFQDVISRGRRREIEALKNLLGEALAGQTGKGYVDRQLERWRTKDPEEWKSGIARIGEFLESTPALLSAVEGVQGLLAFAADWHSRPHFANADQVPIRFSGNFRGGEAWNRFLRELRGGLAENPSVSGLRLFLGPRRSRGDVDLFLERAEGMETWVYFNWRGKAGLKASFTSQGHLTGKLEVRPPFRAGETIAEIEALPESAPTSKSPARRRAESSPPPGWVSTFSGARSVSSRGASSYAPQSGENPTLYAMRLIEASRSPDREVAHAIVIEMEKRLADPDTAEFTRETVQRWVSLSNLAHPSALNGIVAQHYQVGSFRNPLTIVSLPTTFLPESWSQVFGEGLAAVKRQAPTRTVDRAIEIGSGTGWASIILSKLGLAREIVAVDMNPQAAAVGRLNAALNGATHIRFEQGDLLSQLPEDLKADLIVACLPQVRKNGDIGNLREVADYYAGGESYFDRFSLGLIERALEQARTRLQPDGRVLFNLGGRPGRAVLEDLYATQGFQPRLRFGQMIPQDAGTDISSLAAQESASGLRFEFFRPEKPGEPISATEALGVERPHHMLYLMEGRPYHDLLRHALNQRLERGGRLGYTSEAGGENAELRQALAQALGREWGFRLNPDTLLLGPQAETILEGLLRILPTERGPVLYAGMGEDLQPEVLNRYAPLRVSPRFSAVEAELDTSRPSVLVMQLPREAWFDRAGLARLLRRSAERKVHVVFLEDQPIRVPNAPHPLLVEMAASPQVAEFTHVVQALDRRYGAPALPLGLLMSANSTLHLYLSRYADLTHSRASTLTQDVYAQFFQRFGEESLAGENQPGILESVLTGFTMSPSISRALESKPAFESAPHGEHPDPIAMHFGESEWQPPLRLGSLLWEAAHAPRAELEARARQAVVDYLQESRGVRIEPEQVLLGAGVQPLLLSALRGLRDLGGGTLQVAVPRPSYGLFFPTVELSGARLIEYSTRADGRFLTGNGQVGRELSGPHAGRLSAVLLNEPSNPAGQFHSLEQLQGIARQIRESRSYLLFDDVFGLLDFGRGRQRRTPSMRVLQEALGPRLVAFGGVSKEFAAGGLRFGFAVVGDPVLARAMRAHPTAAADPLALNIAPELMRHWEPLLQDHRLYLSSRAYRLEQVFRERQLPVQETQGGYSLFANLSFLHGRRLRLRNGGETVIDSNNLHELLYSEAGLKVHSDGWARVPGHYRLVFSIDRLDEAVDRLKRFFRSAR